MNNKGSNVLINDLQNLHQLDSDAQLRLTVWNSTNMHLLKKTQHPHQKYRNTSLEKKKHSPSHLQSNSTSIVDRSNLLNAITRCHALPKYHVKRYNCHHPDSTSPGRTPPVYQDYTTQVEPAKTKVFFKHWKGRKRETKTVGATIFFGDKGFVDSR